MNSMYFIRIEAIRMENFKSVSKGEVYFNEQKSLIRGEIKDDEFSSILGIYGQNGSGKTTIIECLKIIQQLFSMKFLSNNLINCFRYDEDNIKLETDFYLFNDNEKLRGLSHEEKRTLKQDDFKVYNNLFIDNKPKFLNKENLVEKSKKIDRISINKEDIEKVEKFLDEQIKTENTFKILTKEILDKMMCETISHFQEK